MSLSLLWINGSPRPSSKGRTYDVRNSGSQAVVGRAACASSDDVLAAIDAADAAQPAWEALRPAAKRDIFLKAAEIIQKPKWVAQVMDAMQTETASHLTFAAGEAMATMTQFRDAATNAMNLRGDTMPTNRLDGGTILVEKRPWGTVFAMAPFNSPVNLAARAIAIPLACGNTVVLKSSEFSPRCAEIVVQVLNEVQVVHFVFALDLNELGIGRTSQRRAEPHSHCRGGHAEGRQRYNWRQAHPSHQCEHLRFNCSSTASNVIQTVHRQRKGWKDPGRGGRQVPQAMRV
jgi:delta 1-pyrroline-5-carboxylate dehydrogenase